jgi:BirA family transcriptional regulator, biotin operon repressor / biotin---[acetyl-CoA-carboxylase] ligase
MIRRSESLSGLWHGRLLRFDSLPSTNGWVLSNVTDLRHGDVVWALEQTEGRGRMGRVWLAPAGKSLTFSVVLQDPSFVPYAANLGQVAAWAVQGVLAQFGLAAKLKWPNDVMVRDRKVAGVLCEGQAASAAFVVGVGLNVNVTQRDFRAAKLDRPATSIAIAKGRSFKLDCVLGLLLPALQSALTTTTRQGLTPLLEAWALHDWLAGREIDVRCATESWRGRYLGLGPDGCLRLLDSAGQEHSLWTGDVERIRAV